MPARSVRERVVRAARVGLSVGLGLVFLRSAAGHLANPYYFLGSVYDYQLLPPGIVPVVAAIVPFLELVLAGCLVLCLWARPAALVGVALLTAFVAAQFAVLSRGQVVNCGCFGVAADRPIGWVSVATTMGCLLAAVGLLVRRSAAGPGLAPAARVGATLLELLVVIAILSVLMGLTLGAVQRVRQSAARAQCANNLRQTALALQQYHDATGHFPAGENDYWLPGTEDWDPRAGLSWSARVLPYLEQEALWREYDAGYPGSAADGPSAHRVPILLCPADPVTATPSGPFRNGNPWPVSAAMSYAGVAGSGEFLPPTKQDGLLFRGSAVRAADITDGTANTLLLGERHGAFSRRTGVWGKPRHFGHVAHYITTADTWDLTSPSFGRCPDRPGRFEPGRPDNECDLIHFWSSHPGGAHFAFCDGSVRFLRYSAAEILPVLATRAGGESVIDQY